MISKTIILISFQEQPNLGVGYLSSVLLDANFHLVILDFRLGKERILSHLEKLNPLVVGFSIIYQYHIHKYHELIEYLRHNGIRCHFSAGGHYPSLRPKEFFSLIPSLDSIVLFEGEITFLELVEALNDSKEWQKIKGIAYKKNGSITINPLRELVRNIDDFPPPYRPHLTEFAVGKKYATLLAGRGCVYDCSFCSVRKFYSTPPGPIKRMRRPEMVVREMELLHDQMGSSIFMFQDDDFPVAKPKGPDWAWEFCQRLQKQGFYKKILWKINCRPDEVDSQLFSEMKKCGLFLIYLGIESGTDDGLRFMNKKIKVKQIYSGVKTIKDLDILYDYGFMLFDPLTTIESIHHNLDFLEQIIGDGTSPIGFGKMRPYAETRIEADLRGQGRLIDRRGFEDYHFLSHSVNELYRVVTNAFLEWIGSHEGVANLCKWVRYYIRIYKSFYGNGTAIRNIEYRAKTVIAESNHFAINIIRNICDMLEDSVPGDTITHKVHEKTLATHQHYQMQVKNLIQEIKILHQNH